MSRAQTIATLFRHFDWAQEKLLAAAGGVPKEDLDRAFDIGPGSVRRTLHHVQHTEHAWLDRIDSTLVVGIQEPPEDATMTQIRQYALEIGERRKALISSAAESQLEATFVYQRGADRFSMRVIDALTHVCNHAMHHRAQAVFMLRALGQKPPLTEFLFMQIESPADPQPQLSAAHLSEYLSYTDWARDIVLNSAASLGDEQLDRPFEIGVGSIRKTLVHLDDADRWWMDNWLGETVPVFPQSTGSTSIAELRKRTAASTEARRGFIRTLRDEQLNRPIKAQPEEGRFLTFPLGQTCIEVCNHATHHRANAINMLRQVGVTVPPTDYSVMTRKKV